jgi:hypothetical protein
LVFLIDQYSFVAVPYYWPHPLPVQPSSMAAPFLPIPPPSFPPSPSLHVLYTEAHLPAGVDPDPEQPTPAPTLRYQDSTQTLTFSGEQITSQSTDVGRLLTVTLIHTVDQGDALFSLILPNVVEPTLGALTAISTFGVTTRIAGPMTLPKPPQAMLYTTMSFTGTLSTSQVPPGSA